MIRLCITSLALLLLSGCASIHPPQTMPVKARAPVAKHEVAPMPPAPPPAPAPEPLAPPPVERWHLKWVH
jgi:hypothetical protein